MDLWCWGHVADAATAGADLEEFRAPVFSVAAASGREDYIRNVADHLAGLGVLARRKRTGLLHGRRRRWPKQVHRRPDGRVLPESAT